MQALPVCFIFLFLEVRFLVTEGERSIAYCYGCAIWGTAECLHDLVSANVTTQRHSASCRMPDRFKREGLLRTALVEGDGESPSRSVSSVICTFV